MEGSCGIKDENWVFIFFYVFRFFFFFFFVNRCFINFLFIACKGEVYVASSVENIE